MGGNICWWDHADLSFNGEKGARIWASPLNNSPKTSQTPYMKWVTVSEHEEIDTKQDGCLQSYHNAQYTF